MYSADEDGGERNMDSRNGEIQNGQNGGHTNKEQAN